MRRILDRIPPLDRDRPFRYLGRRVLQALTDAATSNLVLGRRTGPGRFLVIRITATEAELHEWQQQFAESRAAIIQELEREVRAREIQTRGPVDVELTVLTAQGLRSEAGSGLLASLVEPEALADARARLLEAGELILPRRARTLFLETDPPDAQAYLDDRPVGVTPCSLEDVVPGEHRVAFARPGYLFHESLARVGPEGAGGRTVISVSLEPEPAMGLLEIRTFPPGAQVTIEGETRTSPARWRLPVGPAEAQVRAADCEETRLTLSVAQTLDDRPVVAAVRLAYSGPDREEVVGRLIVYKPGPAAMPVATRPEPPPPTAGGSASIRSFFRDDAGEWDIEPPAPPLSAHSGEEVLGEAAVRRGVLLIGRPDPHADLQPDVRLFDPENSVSRGCHAWLWVYADRSTGAAFNTFLIGNNSPAGIRVDGATVMETRRLSEDSVVEIGNFRLRLVKETPAPRVEFNLPP